MTVKLTDIMVFFLPSQLNLGQSSTPRCAIGVKIRLLAETNDSVSKTFTVAAVQVVKGRCVEDRSVVPNGCKLVSF
jgi:hypothetical protein